MQPMAKARARLQTEITWMTYDFGSEVDAGNENSEEDGEEDSEEF